MITRDYAVTMARYGSWQNTALVTAACGLDNTDRRKARGLYFGSIMGTMNHLLWGDQIWLHRFAGTGLPRVTSIADSPDLCADWETLVDQRRRTDQAILDWALALEPSWLEGDLAWFSASAKREITRPRALLVVHLFNHQTHHRGQIHAALTAAGIETALTDLPFMPDQE